MVAEVRRWVTLFLCLFAVLHMLSLTEVYLQTQRAEIRYAALVKERYLRMHEVIFNAQYPLAADKEKS